MTVLDDPHLQARHALWVEDVSDPLPGLLAELLASPRYGFGEGRIAPPNGYGVYLLSSGEEHEYVGRTGLTERTRRSGGRSYSGFAMRLRSHLTPSHNSASLAYRKTCEAFRREGRPLASSRKANCADPCFMKAFRAEIDAIRAMDLRRVAIGDERLSAVFEIYAATVLSTKWNSFPTS